MVRTGKSVRIKAFDAMEQMLRSSALLPTDLRYESLVMLAFYLRLDLAPEAIATAIRCDDVGGLFAGCSEEKLVFSFDCIVRDLLKEEVRLFSRREAIRTQKLDVELARKLDETHDDAARRLACVKDAFCAWQGARSAR